MRKSYAVIIDTNLDQITAVASVATVAVAVAVAGRTAVAVAVAVAGRTAVADSIVPIAV